MDKANDYFSLLEVSTTASKEEVQRAFMAKALIWHPDKAANEEQRDEFSKIYERLQDAYRVLSNDKARKQYMDAKTASFQDLASASIRDTTYSVSNEYRKPDGTFDQDAFNNAFHAGRDAAERQKLEAASIAPLSTAEFMSRLAQRDMDISSIQSGLSNPFAQAGLSWDVNTFNRAFDEMRKRQPSNELEPYSCNPVGAARGLQELHALDSRMSFDGAEMSDLIRGGATNFAVANIDLRQFHTGELYGVEPRLSAADINLKVDAASDDRQRLATLSEEQFEVEPTEVEKAFSELFRPAKLKDEEVEGLEARST
jgi:curved DNA-binding protein CbpA